MNSKFRFTAEIQQAHYKPHFSVSSTLSDNIYNLHEKNSTYKEGTIVLFFPLTKNTG